jgi:hypothetical protein
MKWTPKPYMIRGVETLVKQCGGGLLLDPGMSKTAITLAAFDTLMDYEYATKMLVIAPLKPMYGTWRQEGRKWDDFNHLTFAVIHGSAREKEAALNEDVNIHLINPEGLKWLFQLYKGKLPEWEVLVVDESTKFKNTRSQRFKMLKKHMGDFFYRWILTGTITPNGLQDLFGQMYILDEGKALGRYITHFRNKFFYQEGYGGFTYKPIPGAVDQVAELVAHMVLKLNAEDYVTMPEFNRIIREVDIGADAMAKYKEVEKEFILELQSGTIVAANSGAAGTKCRQIANGQVYDGEHVAHFIHDAKVQALEEIVEETNGAPLLVIYEYQHDLESIMALLGKGAKCITGVTGKAFVKLQDDFNAGTLPFLVGHAGSMHGLNIQGFCYHMVWYGITWNLEHYIQTVWRLYRQGQSAKMVMCYMLVATGTLDEHVVQVLDHKQGEQDNLDNLLMSYNPYE